MGRDNSQFFASFVFQILLPPSSAARTIAPLSTGEGCSLWGVIESSFQRVEAP